MELYHSLLASPARINTLIPKGYSDWIIIDENKQKRRVDNTFDVRFKDGTALYAWRVAESRDHDLALLKIDGYKVPFLSAADPAALSQGDTVYAIPVDTAVNEFSRWLY